MNRLSVLVLPLLLFQTLSVFGQTEGESSSQTQLEDPLKSFWQNKNSFVPDVPEVDPLEELMSRSREEHKAFFRNLEKEQEESRRNLKGGRNSETTQSPNKRKSHNSSKQNTPGNFVPTKEERAYLDALNPFETTGASTYTSGLGELKRMNPNASYMSGVPISQEQINNAKEAYYWNQAEPFIWMGVLIVIIIVGILLGVKISKEVKSAKANEKDNPQNS